MERNLTVNGKGITLKKLSIKILRLMIGIEIWSCIEHYGISKFMLSIPLSGTRFGCCWFSCYFFILKKFR